MSAQQKVTADATLDASEYCYTLYPRLARTGYPLILLHGAGSPDQYAGAVGWPSSLNLAHVAARGVKATGGQGIATVSTYLNGDKYANDTVMSRISLALASVATRTGCSSVKAHLFGTSMGGGAAIRYAALNPAKVASVNVIIPMASIKSLYAQNPAGPIVGGFAALIAAAWGKTYRTVTDVVFNGTTAITSATGFTSADVGRLVMTNIAVRQAYGTPKVPFGTTIVSQSGTGAVMSAAASVSSSGNAVGFGDPLPTGTPSADLLALAPAIASAGIPFRAFYSTIDPYIDPADVQAVATAAGGSAIALDSTYGHANGTVNELASYNGGSNLWDLLTYLINAGA